MTGDLPPVTPESIAAAVLAQRREREEATRLTGAPVLEDGTLVLPRRHPSSPLDSTRAGH
jgi:hypothetical protein